MSSADGSRQIYLDNAQAMLSKHIMKIAFLVGSILIGTLFGVTISGNVRHREQIAKVRESNLQTEREAIDKAYISLRAKRLELEFTIKNGITKGIEKAKYDLRIEKIYADLPLAEKIIFDKNALTELVGKEEAEYMLEEWVYKFSHLNFNDSKFLDWLHAAPTTERIVTLKKSKVLIKAIIRNTNAI